MANVLVNEQSLRDAADAVRAKLGVQTAYKPGQLAAAIASIPTEQGKPYIDVLNAAIFHPDFCKTPAQYIQSAMQVALDPTNRTFTTSWLGGSSIGFRNYNLFPVVRNAELPLAALHYKLTTGSRSYNTSVRFAPGLGILKQAYISNAMNGEEINAFEHIGWWQKNVYTTDRNTVLEGSFDLTDLSEPGWLVLFGAGWDCVWSEIRFS